MTDTKDTPIDRPKDAPRPGKLRISKETLKDLDTADGEAIRGGMRADETAGCTPTCGTC